MESLRPMLLTTLKGYTKEKLIHDVIAGVIVAIIALPLSIALALASGVGPEEGLYTAIVAGFLISALGGSTVQIAGPTAAFATIVAGVVAQNGMDGLMLATIMAGVLLILMGLFKFGSLIRFIPLTITTGFTAGISVTILIGQLKDFFGLTYPEGVSPIETVEKLEAVAANFGTVNLWAVVVGLVSLAILILWPKVKGLNRIPASLVTVVVGALAVKLLELPVHTIGDLYTIEGGLPSFRLPQWDFAMARSVLPDALTIAILAAIESLLSCVVADGMTGTKHRSNAELVAQGVGNLGAAFFGGIPATGAIARTAANVKNGGTSPVAGMVHAAVLLLVMLVLMPYAALIPMPVIAAVLFQVAYNMSHWKGLIHIIRTAPRSDVLILLLSFVLTVVFDLVVAIGVGLVLACVLFMKRMSDETVVRGWKYIGEADAADEKDLRYVSEGIRVFEISGPLFFGSANVIEDVLEHENVKVVVLRMRSVTVVDATAMDTLMNLHVRCEAEGVALVLSHVNGQPMEFMTRTGVAEKIGRENFRPNIESALDRAEELVKQTAEA